MSADQSFQEALEAELAKPETLEEAGRRIARTMNARRDKAQAIVDLRKTKERKDKAQRRALTKKAKKARKRNR